jgi:hypothetical protein
MIPPEYQIPLFIYTTVVENPFLYGILVGGGVMYMCFWVMYQLSPMQGFLTMAYTPKSESDSRRFEP